MLSRKLKVFFCIAALVIMAAGVGVYAAGVYGTQDDPLITKSYLDEVLAPQLEKQFQNALSEAGGTFSVVSLESGKILTAAAGCELILRSGSATVYAPTSGLVDTTDGTSAPASSSVVTNHLYMVASDYDGVKAGSSGATLLVCGSYTIS